MLGDDTWLKLFPGLFVRHDGVSSFFVSIERLCIHKVCIYLSAPYIASFLCL